MIRKSSVIRGSFLVFAAFIASVWGLKLMTPFLTVIFSLLVLEVLSLKLPKRLTVVTFTVVVIGAVSASIHFSRELAQEIPSIAEKTIPTITEYSKQYNFELPFSDWTSLMENIKARTRATTVALAAQLAIKEFVYLTLGLVIATALFINSKLDLDQGRYPLPNNLYSALCSEIAKRFRNFYLSFKLVMGAQIVISTINTLFTGIFVLLIGLPFAKTVIFITFVAGLLPIVGNLISNTIIFSIGLTVSPELAIGALVYLILLHKLEYFLNSKIIGGRIRNPMWLTLIALILGEAVAGIPGMILAPVFFRYIKAEASLFEAEK